MTTATQTAMVPLLREGIRRAQLDCVLSGRALAERVIVRLTPRFKTACWFWRDSHHNILVGEDVIANAREGLDDEKLVQYVGAYVRHEYSHARWTVRDLPAVKQALKEQKLPFSLFNLFEDARIEHLERKASGQPFGWVNYEPLSTSFQPGAVFWQCIHFEGDLEAVRDHVGEHMVEEELESVFDFYRQALLCEEFEDMLELMKRWLEVYPPPPPSLSREGRKPGGGSGEGQEEGSEESRTGEDEQSPPDTQTDELPTEGLAVGAELAENDEAFEAAIADAETCEAPTTGGSPVEAKEAHSVPVAESGEGSVLVGRHQGVLDSERVSRIAVQLRSLFQAKARNVSTWEPSRRISVRNDLSDRAPYRQRKEFGRKKRRVHLVVDCSGSMSGHHIEEARHLVAALSELARAGICEGKVTFSAVGGSQAREETWALPLPESTLSGLLAWGDAEGLEYAMRANLQSLRQSDIVMVFTDGQICDMPIDKVFWHSQNVYTWGLYAGRAEHYVLEALKRFFDRPVVRPSIEELLQAMIGMR